MAKAIRLGGALYFAANTALSYEVIKFIGGEFLMLILQFPGKFDAVLIVLAVLLKIYLIDLFRIYQGMAAFSWSLAIGALAALPSIIGIWSLVFHGR